MENITYKVYVKLDSNNCIISVESTCFNKEEDLFNTGYVFIDKGSDGNVYAHAQANYLTNKYGHPLTDNEGNYNYKLVDLVPTLLTVEEKATLFPEVPNPITDTERIAIVEEALQELILGGMDNV